MNKILLGLSLLLALPSYAADISEVAKDIEMASNFICTASARPKMQCIDSVYLDLMESYKTGVEYKKKGVQVSLQDLNDMGKESIAASPPSAKRFTTLFAIYSSNFFMRGNQ